MSDLAERLRGESETLKMILEAWTDDEAFRGEFGHLDLPFNIEDFCACMDERLAALESPWVSVYENPPKIGQWCWICDNGVVQREAWQWDASDDGDEMIYFWWREDADPVAPRESQTWMPLPPPPKNERTDWTREKSEPAEGE